METTQAIILSVFLTGLMAIISWALVTVVSHGKRIVLLEKSWTDSVSVIQSDILLIKSDIGKLNSRLDTFIHSELDALKSIVKGKEN